MAFLSTEKTHELYCKSCGNISPHARKAVSYDAHFLVMFFTMFLWTPVTIVAAIIDRFRRYRCQKCGSVYEGPIPQVDPKPTDIDAKGSSTKNRKGQKT